MEGQLFLQHDEGAEAGKDRFLIFATTQDLHALATRSMGLMDGTFSVAPNVFYLHIHRSCKGAVTLVDQPR